MTLTSKAQRFKSKFITAELANLFSQSDSEEEFQGFSDDDEEEEERSGCFGKWLEDKTESEDSAADTGFYSDGDDEPPPKRQSLCVALKFPTKRLSTPKPELSEKKKTNVKKQTRAAPPPRRSSERKKVEAREEKEERDNEDEDEEDEEEEVVPQSLRKRDKNISENKAMLAKLFADLTTMAELSSLSTPQQKKKPSSRKTTPRKRKFEPESGAERRNPSRKARPPENFAVEERSASPGRGERRLKTVDIRRLVEVDEEQADGCRKKRRGYASKKCRYVVKSVEDISPEELENVAYRSKDKIWDKENGSSCHQCRQKTLDTKTVCRSGMCVGGKGQFCGPCLKNRYGEDVCTVLLDPAWSCPICRGVCNCSLCRKKEGRCATGILVGLARYNGHDNVHKYLESIQKELQ